jgi:hypothetical protein
VVRVDALLKKGYYELNGDVRIGAFQTEPDASAAARCPEQFVSVPAGKNYNTLVSDRIRWYAFCLDLVFDGSVPQNLYLELSGTTARHKLYFDGKLIDDCVFPVNGSRDERGYIIPDGLLSPGVPHRLFVVCLNDETARKQRFFYYGAPVLRLSSNLYQEKTLQSIINVTFIIVYGLGAVFFLLVFYQYRNDYGLVALALLSLIAGGYYMLKIYTGYEMSASMYLFLKRVQYSFLFSIPSLFILYIYLLRYRTISQWRRVFMLGVLLIAGAGGGVPFAITNISMQYAQLKVLFVLVWGIGFIAGLGFMLPEVAVKIKGLFRGQRDVAVQLRRGNILFLLSLPSLLLQHFHIL